MTELKIQNKQVIAIDEKGYRIVFATKPVNTSDFKATEKIARDFFNTFELNNIIPTPLPAPIVKELIPKPKGSNYGNMTIKLLESIWKVAKQNLSDDGFTFKEFQIEMSKTAGKDINYRNGTYYIKKLVNEGRIIHIDKNKYRKFIVIPSEENTKNKNNLIANS